MANLQARSLVAKLGSKSQIWLFPECSTFLLDHQLPSGGWESYASPIDGILNTAAALRALNKHRRTSDTQDLSERCRKAEAALQLLLEDYDTSSSDHVGFELLLVQHLSLLETEAGIIIDFRQRGALEALRDEKLGTLPLTSVYEAPSTWYHSLEALIGYIDFDKVRPLRESNGSMMGSPSSTAAYLMYASEWDDEAETSLQNVINFGACQRDGSVPCAWPTTIFEITWVITTIDAAGIKIDVGEAPPIAKLLNDTLLEQNGVFGFGRVSFADADDTAKGITTLRILGTKTGIESLLKTFERETHFKTYPGERNPSFSAHCNILICLLKQDDPTHFITQISKAVNFLVSHMLQGKFHEKWVSLLTLPFPSLIYEAVLLTDLYWIMLLAEVLEVLYQNENVIQKLFQHNPSFKETLPFISLHLLIRILVDKRNNGSWDNGHEPSAYAILALSFLARLPWIQSIDIGGTISAMARGKSFLFSKRDEWPKGNYLWIEKVAYAPNLLSEAYCIAASMARKPSDPKSQHQNPETVTGIPGKIIIGMRKAGALIQQSPLFLVMESHIMRVAELQTCYALLIQKRKPSTIFPATVKGGEKSFFIIPLAFTTCTAFPRSSISISALLDMIHLSSLNFLIDEYMESVIAQVFRTQLKSVKDVIRQVCSYTFLAVTQDGLKNFGSNEAQPENVLPRSPRDGVQTDGQSDFNPLGNVQSVLYRFVHEIMCNPAVVSSPASVRNCLCLEVEKFLLAHVTHAEDSHKFACRNRYDCKKNGLQSSTEGLKTPLVYTEPVQTFYNWVRSTSADDTSCPFSFVFYNCLVRKYSKLRTLDVFGSARTAYLAEDLCRHLASICRIYNDYGSVKRDAKEDNLNSINFPEFQSVSKAKRKVHFMADEEVAKSELLWIADYERRGLEASLAALEEEVGSQDLDIIDSIKLFINVTNLYGQIYVLKDIGTSTASNVSRQGVSPTGDTLFN
ncbi:unnamed protein product [Clonostachys chloroleuca]|uniref:Uncharacterized protein n=1 Tax=Clonostachys chloroleuca TaxID=1926264 RepID=A0AA35LZK0_9HYPO|nr:unnamed protein product [Clonostachys chloroleuca]